MWVGDNHVARREGITTDTLDLAERYVRHIAHDHPEYLDEAAMHRWQRPGAADSHGERGKNSGGVTPGRADLNQGLAGRRSAGRAAGRYSVYSTLKSKVSRVRQ